MADQALALSRAGATVEETSIFEETKETIRRLLQHLVLAALLGVRLYMLPLLFLCHKLTRPDDDLYLSTWNFLFQTRRLRSASDACDKTKRVSWLCRMFGRLKTGVSAPLRIVRTLYILGNMIEEATEKLESPKCRRLSSVDSAIDVESIETSEVEEIETDVKIVQTGDAASASQVYHAALLNGNTLDDLLAAFGATKLNLDDPSQRHGEDFKNYRKYEYCNSSIQSTPERMMTPCQPSDSRNKTLPSVIEVSSQGIKRDASAANFGQKAAKTPSRETKVSTPDRSAGKSSNFQVNIGIEGNQSQENISAAPGLKRCPTFVRRHANSRLPRRTMSQDKVVFEAANSEKQTPTMSTHLGSPMRRGRMQRRLNVFRDFAVPEVLETV